MGQCYIGTSGFSYRDWLGHFYPPGLESSEFLSYYSSKFSFVELNFTYYRQPQPAVLEKMLAAVPDSFLFTLKAHQSLTHERSEDWNGAVQEFAHGLLPLTEAGQCGGILLQFPYSFHYTPENRRYLAELSSALQEALAAPHTNNTNNTQPGGSTAPNTTSGSTPAAPLLVEFRNHDWEQPQVFSEMQSRGLGLVVTDHPDLKNLPQTSNMVTADTAYLRFHGRNKENWWSGDNVSRYDYLYSREELEERLPDVHSMRQTSTRLFVAFNNHRKGQAAQSALLFSELMGPN